MANDTPAAMDLMDNATARSTEIPGVILIDAILQAFTLGIILCQATKYFMTYLDDSRRMQIYVGVVVLLAVFQSALEEYKVWREVINHKTWGTSNLEWSDLFLNGCICSICGVFLIRRCWKVTNKNLWVLIFLGLLSTTIFGANIYLAVAVQRVLNGMPMNNDELRGKRYLAPATLVAFSYWLIGSLVLDAMVTLILIVFLWRSRTGLGRSNKVIWKIIALTWESAMFPSISMIVAASLFRITPNRMDQRVIFFTLLTGKLYTLGLLRTINSRAKLRERMKSEDLGRTNLEDWEWDQSESTTRAGSGAVTSGTFVNSILQLPSATHEPISKPNESSSVHSLVTSIIGIPTAGSHLGSPNIDARECGVAVKRIVSKASEQLN